MRKMTNVEMQLEVLDSLGYTPGVDDVDFGAAVCENPNGVDDWFQECSVGVDDDPVTEPVIEEVLITVKNNKTGEVKKVNTVDYCFLSEDWKAID